MTREAWCRLGDGPFMTRSQRSRRVARVIEGELTDCQRRMVLEHYVEQKTVTQIAREQGVNKSTVSRTLQRAEQRMKRCLMY